MVVRGEECRDWGVIRAATEAARLLRVPGSAGVRNRSRSREGTVALLPRVALRRLGWLPVEKSSWRVFDIGPMPRLKLRSGSGATRPVVGLALRARLRRFRKRPAFPDGRGGWRWEGTADDLPE